MSVPLSTSFSSGECTVLTLGVSLLPTHDLKICRSRTLLSNSVPPVFPLSRFGKYSLDRDKRLVEDGPDRGCNL